MTGYTVHTGSNDKFSSGWDRIFEGKKTSKERKAPAKASKPAKKAAKKK